MSRGIIGNWLGPARRSAGVALSCPHPARRMLRGIVVTGSHSLLMLSVLAVATSALLSILVLPIARTAGWLDAPAERKVHKQPTPLLGGLAVFVGYFSIALGAGLTSRVFLAASFLVLAIGLIDDRWPLSARVRFLAQAVACLMMVYGAGYQLNDFGQLFWSYTLSLGILAVPITVFSALGVINAFNMIDGIDGLSGGVFLVAAGAMTVFALGDGREVLAAQLLLSMGCVIGFLLLNARFPWNPQARLFLGDSGSGLLGFWLAWWFVSLGSGADRLFAPMTAVWLIGLPLLDTTRLMGNRWRAGKSAFEADRFHLHHAFLRAGFSAVQTALAMTGLAGVFAGVGLLMEFNAVPDYLSFYSFVAVGIVYLLWMRSVWSRERFLGRVMQHG